MPRLFTGLEIPDDVALDLQIMQGGIPGARWLDRENFHLTLRFVGDIEHGLAREFALGLESSSARPFPLQLKGVGLFGGNKPHSIYAGVADSPELLRLHEQHDRLARVLGLPSEGRKKFVPHVTLARLKEPEPRALQRWIEVHSLFRSQIFDVGQFVLFSSRPLKGGGPYAVEEAYPLRDGLMMGAA